MDLRLVTMMTAYCNMHMNTLNHMHMNTLNHMHMNTLNHMHLSVKCMYPTFLVRVHSSARSPDINICCSEIPKT